jgi:hypothetical protein
MGVVEVNRDLENGRATSRRLGQKLGGEVYALPLAPHLAGRPRRKGREMWRLSKMERSKNGKKTHLEIAADGIQTRPSGIGLADNAPQVKTCVHFHCPLLLRVAGFCSFELAEESFQLDRLLRCTL